MGLSSGVLLRFWLGAACVIFCCECVTGAAAQSNPFAIGGIAILSGENSSYGVQVQRGATLALEEINAAGGVRGSALKIIWEDETAGRAERAVAAYKKLTLIDKAHFIIGPSFQDGLLAIAPLAQKDGTMLISASTPSLNLPNVFSTWIDPDQEADYLAKLMIETYRRVALLASQQSWEEMVGKRFKETFSKLGGEVVADFRPLQGTTDLKAEVLRTRAAKPEAVLISAYTLFPSYAKELKAQSVKAPNFTI
jgi:branched-chain amino acid transport system substrate-binding protein